MARLGCMESLVHYKRLVLRNDPIGSEGLVEECTDLLQQLTEIDHQRRARYEDIGEYQLPSAV
jgi:hypothetical protein